MEQSLRNRHRSGRRDSLYPDEKKNMCMNLKLVKLSQEYREQLYDMMAVNMQLRFRKAGKERLWELNWNF